MGQIIYLAYANQASSPLPALKREEEETYRILFEEQQKSFFLPFKCNGATTAQVASDLVKFREDIAIFHYSGHASGDRLMLEDLDGDPLGLAVMLSKCPQLRVIFLNGCTTKEQVECMLAGEFSKVVIATDVKISDDIAAEFAIRLYEQLNFKGTTIREAFDYAKGVIQFRHKLRQEYRGIGSIKMSDETSFAWELYATDKNAENWSLDYAITGYYRQDRLGMDGFLKKLAYAYEPIVRLLLDWHTKRDLPASEAARDVIEEWEQFKISIAQIKNGKRYNSGRIIERIANILPTLVGVNIKHFLREIKKEPSYFELAHLELAINIFDACMQLLSFSMLSQLWEAINYTGKVLSPSSDLEHLKSFFLKNSEEIKSSTLIEVIKSSRRLFESIMDDHAEEKIVKEKFVSELYELKKEYLEDSPLQKAIFFFSTLKKRLSETRVQPQQVGALFIEAEYKLSTFLARINFILRYSLVTVKSINVLKYRHYQHPAFKHKMAPLLIQNTFTYEPYQFDDFALTQTVVLLKDLNRMGDNLPLSPFIFDKNVFYELSNESDLMVYGGYNTDTDTFLFRRISNPTETELVSTGSDYSLIKEQLDAFSTALFGKPFKELR